MEDLTPDKIKMIEEIEDLGGLYDENSTLTVEEQLETCRAVTIPKMPEELIKPSRYFFMLCRQAGFDPIETKERAKKKFNLEHFSQISKYQLAEVTQSLQTYIDNKILGLDKSQPTKPVTPTKPQAPPTTSVTSKYGSF